MENTSDTHRLPLIVDSRELARTGRTLDGGFAVRSLERLASLLSRDEGGLVWRVRGERRQRADGGHDDFLHLGVDGRVAMQCVRCLGDASVAVHVDRGFRLVGSEAQAAREDTEESELDVLVGGARFDLGELIEDEAIMSLPPIARHENCSLPVEAGDPDPGQAAVPSQDEARANPFAALTELKKRDR
ncbi:YceD family protein [Zeimonas arvi]|uniref:Large ribosomal RNA subunit accumulation protein YceD n=1 Tax=Zeimonas arvi TaxID=2498847 RepID=A0A5C8P1C1_9BURK|nr:YceD family protein [Zeimonas arvi]TXL67351.1 DUF177 domain-containing protein [Zeimonas arvi]